jgi:WD40 repeat protein
LLASRRPADATLLLCLTSRDRPIPPNPPGNGVFAPVTVELRGHQPGSAVRHVRFLTDGQLITGSDDGTVRQWNLPGDASAAELAAELQVRSAGTL